MPECEVPHCSELGAERIHHPAAPTETRWLCLAHLGPWLEANPDTRVSGRTRKRLARRATCDALLPRPTSPSTEKKMPKPTKARPKATPSPSHVTPTQKATLEALAELAPCTLEALRQHLGLKTETATYQRVYALEQRGLVEDDATRGKRLDYATLTDKGRAALEAKPETRNKVTRPPVVEQSAEKLVLSAAQKRAMIGQLAEDANGAWRLVELGDSRTVDALVRRDLINEDRSLTDKGWAYRVRFECEDPRGAAAAAPPANSDPAPPAIEAAATDDVIIDDPQAEQSSAAETDSEAMADVRAALDGAIADDFGPVARRVMELSTRVHNQAQVIEALCKDLAAAKEATVDPETRAELEDLRRRSAETSNVLEGFEDEPTTAQGEAVRRLYAELQQARETIENLTMEATSIEEAAGHFAALQDVWAGFTVDEERHPAARSLRELLEERGELRASHAKTFGHGVVQGTNEVYQRLRWILDPRQESKLDSDVLIEQVRLLKAAADAVTPYSLEAEEDAIYLRAGHPRFGLRILLASWDEVGPNGGAVHLFDWMQSEHHSVPVTSPEMGKAVALALLKARGIDVPELVFADVEELDTDEPTADKPDEADEEVSCAS